MTHFHTAFSAVLTCVGTGSTLGSIFKGKRKHLLEVCSTERTPVELGPSESLVGVEQTVSSPGNTFVHSYLHGLISKTKNGAEAVSSLIMSLLKSRVPDTFSDTLWMWGGVGPCRRMGHTGGCPDVGLFRALWPFAAPCASTL